MAYGKRTLVAGTYQLGSIGPGRSGSLVISVENITGSIAIKGTSEQSGMTKTAIEGYNVNLSATKLVSITVAGTYKFPCGGMECDLVVTTGPADVAYNFVTGE